MPYRPERDSLRLRNATVHSVNGATVGLTLDGQQLTGVPVHGTPPPVGSRVLVLEQGAGLLVLGEGLRLSDLDARFARRGPGSPLRVASTRVTLTYDGTWHRVNLSGLGISSISTAFLTPWGTADALHISVVDSAAVNFGVSIWRWDGTKFTLPLGVAITIWGT
jgi:hypothetical protein